MKKNIHLTLLLLSVFMMDTLFVACSKADDSDTYSFEAPQYQASARKLTFHEGDIKSVEFSESGRYIMEKTVTKAEETLLITGTYSVNGNTYILTGEFNGTIEVSGTETADNISVVVTENGQAAVTIPAESARPASDETLYRTWMIDNLRMKVTGGNLNAAGVSYTTKSGADLHEIALYLKENGVDFDADRYSGYNIKAITVSGCGGFIVDFEEADPYVGQCDISGMSFSYDFTIDTGGSDLFNASGQGTVRYISDICVLTLNGTIHGNANTYDVVLEFRLTES